MSAFCCLLILALASRLSFLFALYAGLFIVLSLTELGKHTRLYALSFKTTERAVERFVFLNSDFSPSLSLPSLSARDIISNINIILFFFHFVNRKFEFA